MGPPRKIDKFLQFFDVSIPCKRLLEMGPEGPTNPDVADILGNTDFYFEDVRFWDFLDPTFPDFPGSRFSKFQISRFPDFQISRFFSDPNLTPFPTRLGIKYFARTPCCDRRSLEQRLWKK